jgi:CheY-like chemotaxis protein
MTIPIFSADRGSSLKRTDIRSRRQRAWRTAFAKLEQFTPDIILADLMMEHYDTVFVFCKRIKDNPAMREVPIIMQISAPKLTGFTFDASNPRTKKWIMVDEVITKPVPLDQLLGKIECYLGKAQGK